MLLSGSRRVRSSFFARMRFAVLAREADGVPAGLVDRRDDLLVDRARQHHLDDLDRGAVGDAQAIDEIALDLQALEHLADLRAAAMDDDRVHPDLFQKHDVLGEHGADRAVAHRVAAIFHDDRGTRVAPEIGQRRGERRGFRHGIGDGIGHARTVERISYAVIARLPRKIASSLRSSQ